MKRLLLMGLLTLLSSPTWQYPLVAGQGHASAGSYDHPLIEQKYHLRPDGDADVEEIRSFRFAGSLSSASIVRTTRLPYSTSTYDLDYKGVWDADTQ